MLTDAYTSQFGDFTVFGFTRNPGSMIQRLSARLGIAPRTIDFGSLGQFFFYTSYGDVAESEEALVLKLGFLRSTTKSQQNRTGILSLPDSYGCAATFLCPFGRWYPLFRCSEMYLEVNSALRAK